MNDIRIAMGTLLICFGLCVIGSNYIRQIRNWLNCQKGIGKRSSPTIMLGPLCYILGYAILPAAFSYLIFSVFLFDRDTLILVLRLPSLFKALCQGENLDNTGPYTSSWLRRPAACKGHLYVSPMLSNKRNKEVRDLRFLFAGYNWNAFLKGATFAVGSLELISLLGYQ